MKTPIDQIPIEKRVLITGGTGLIGSRLVQSLNASEYLVTILTRSETQHSHPLQQYVSWDGHQIDRRIGPHGTVINLAGAGIADHRWTPSYKKLILESRVKATKACVDWIHEQAEKPKVFISASAVGIYGTADGKPKDESSPAGNDFLSKVGLAWEGAAKGTGIRTVIPRIGVVMAPEGGAFPRLLTPFKFYAGGYIGTGNQAFPWIHIEDVVGLFRFAMDQPSIEGPLNIVAPEIRNNKQFAHTVGKHIGKPSGLPVPAFAVKALMGESSVILLEGQRVVPRKALDKGYVFLFPKSDSAIAHLLESMN